MGPVEVDGVEPEFRVQSNVSDPTWDHLPSHKLEEASKSQSSGDCVGVGDFVGACVGLAEGTGVGADVGVVVGDGVGDCVGIASHLSLPVEP